MKKDMRVKLLLQDGNEIRRLLLRARFEREDEIAKLSWIWRREIKKRAPR
jgi:hypothetical protein